jgi:hypothetical protein
MFSLFNPKMTVDDFAGVGARVIYKIAASDASANMETMKANFISAGADEQALNLELAAFAFFCNWAGAARALQKGKLSAKTFEQLITAIDARLRQAVDGTLVDRQSLAIYDMSFVDFASERLDVFCTLTQEHPSQNVLSKIVDTFCRFLGEDSPSAELRLMTQQLYLLTEGTCYDQIAGTKLI